MNVIFKTKKGEINRSFKPISFPYLNEAGTKCYKVKPINLSKDEDETTWYVAEWYPELKSWVVRQDLLPKKSPIKKGTKKVLI